MMFQSNDLHGDQSVGSMGGQGGFPGGMQSLPSQGNAHAIISAPFIYIPMVTPEGTLITVFFSSGGNDREDKNSAVTKQQRWLLFLRHCAKCRQSEQECSLKAQCKFGKQLWHHILHCASPQCDFPRCTNSKELLKHHQKCQVRHAPLPCTHQYTTMRCA